MDLTGLRPTAAAIAQRIEQLVKTVVGRAIQVAMVNGSKRKLDVVFSNQSNPLRMKQTYAAPTATSSHLISLRGEVKSGDDLATPDWAIRITASAETRSTSM